MLKYPVWIYIIMVLLCAAVSCENEPANIYDHAMTHSVPDSYPYLPADRTTSFSANDDDAISWIELGRDIELQHQVSWNWYSPDGVLYKTDSGTTDPGAWEWYRMWTSIPIRGNEPANMPGNWQVRIYLDGQYILTEWFSIRKS